MKGLVFLVLAALVIAVLLRWQTELFVLRVEKGKARVVRGRVPPTLLQDLLDVVKLGPAENARMSIVLRSGRAAVEARGDWSEGQIQKLRNVVGLWPLAKLRSR